MGNMERADYLGAFRDLGRLIKIGKMVPLPLDFGTEAFVGMAVAADVKRVWAAYASVIGEEPAGGGDGRGIDLRAVVEGVGEDGVAGFKAGFAEEDATVSQLLSGLMALPATGADVEVDLNVDYRGRKVKRKRPGVEDMCDSKEEWEAGEPEYLPKGQGRVVLGPDGQPMTILDVIRKAIETRHSYMGQKKRRTGPKKKGQKPTNDRGMRAA